MLSCEQISKLVSESFERQLTLGERFSLRMHVTLCGTCRMFRRFQERLHQVVHGVVAKHDRAEGDPSVELSPETRNRIQELVASSSSSSNTPDQAPKDNGKT